MGISKIIIPIAIFCFILDHVFVLGAKRKLAETESGQEDALAVGQSQHHKVDHQNGATATTLDRPTKKKKQGPTVESEDTPALGHMELRSHTHAKAQLLNTELAKIGNISDSLSKYVELAKLHKSNVDLFYGVLGSDIEKFMPVVYTPTVGDACEKFSEINSTPPDVYVTINDNSVDKILEILSKWPEKDVRAIVVTDGGRILGLGDLGANGMGIPIGKLALYVALAGVQPKWTLPVMIDVGTDNEKLLTDPKYIGLKRKREQGSKYYELIKNFMEAVEKKYGRNVLIQFEDFGNQNAGHLLDEYRHKYCTFNDDIQGTAAVAVAGLLTASRITEKKLSQTTILFLGAGGAALGIAELCVLQMMSEGITQEEAYKKIYMMDKDGMITTYRKDNDKNFDPRHKAYAKNMKDSKEFKINVLLDMVKKIKPGILIGVSTKGGSFTKEVLEEMEINNRPRTRNLKHNRPVVFALSNPSKNSECTAKDAYTHTNGNVLFASGSPFDDVELGGKIYKPSQGNNAYIFPGVALAVILFKIETISDQLFLLAARTLAKSVNDAHLAEIRLYPRIREIPEISIKIAIAIADKSYEDGTAKLPPVHHKENFIRSQIYKHGFEELLKSGAHMNIVVHDNQHDDRMDASD